MIFCYVTVFFRAFERLEPDEVKVSSPVLRGGGGSNAASLPGGPSIGSGGRIAQYRGDNAEYFLGDALGSVRQLTNAQGKVILGKNYQPFGEELPSPGTGKTNYGFTGEWSEAGLVYLRARFYAPQQGRFISRDTWEGDYNKPLSLNKWLYVTGNPANLTDPSGKSPLLKFEKTNDAPNMWNDAEKTAAEQAANDVAQALARTINANRYLLKIAVGLDINSCNSYHIKPVSPSLAFFLVYSGPVTFRHIVLAGQGGAVGEAQSWNLVNVFSNYPANYAVRHPGWVVHELGHAFEQATSPQEPWNAPGRLGIPIDLLVRTRDPEYRDPNAGFAGGFEDWYFSRSNDQGEVFADMFLGWIYNHWATDRQTGRLTDMAQDRVNYMNQNMPRLIEIALKKQYVH